MCGFQVPGTVENRRGVRITGRTSAFQTCHHTGLLERGWCQTLKEHLTCHLNVLLVIRLFLRSNKCGGCGDGTVLENAVLEMDKLGVFLTPGLDLEEGARPPSARRIQNLPSTMSLGLRLTVELRAASSTGYWEACLVVTGSSPVSEGKTPAVNPHLSGIKAAKETRPKETGQWERKPFCTTDVLQLLGCLGSFGGGGSIGQELLPSILKHRE